MDATGVAHCSGVQRSWIATGPAHTHRIPRPVLTPRQGSGHAPLRGVLATALRPAVGGGVLRRPQMASPLSTSRQQQQAKALSRSALRARDALVLEHLPLADAVASAVARRFFPLVEREDLIQVAREALIRSAPRCQSWRACRSISAPLHQRGPAAPPARSRAPRASAQAGPRSR